MNLTLGMTGSSSMAKRSRIVVWIALASVVGGWAWLRLGHAQELVDQTTQQFHTTSRDVSRIIDLRSRTVVIGTGVRTDVDLVTRAQRALSAVGLPIRACKGVQPRSGSSGPAGGIRQQQVELLLQGLSPGEFGSWLSAWNTPDQPWRIREVLFNHQVEQSLAGQHPSSLDSNRFQITVLLTAPTAEDTP